MEMGQIVAAALIFVATGGVVYVLAFPYLSGESLAEKRLKALTTPGKQSDANADRAKRSNVANTLKELDTRQKNRDKLTIEKRIAYAGVSWSKPMFFLISAAMALICALVLLLATFKPLLAVVGLLIGGIGLPRWLLSYLRKRRIKQFVADLPSAMDIIVRGVRVGLPIRDCLRTIATEATGPVQIEFRGVMEAMALGVPLREAIFRLPENVPISEANFIAIVVSLQQVSGGNLSTALANLSFILRERKKMRDKVSAISMEAKASAAIIGSLPVIVAGLVHLSTPSYLDPLWHTQVGNYILWGSALLMAFGVAVMRKMINFKI